jgi:hypothetical protein
MLLHCLTTKRFFLLALTPFSWVGDWHTVVDPGIMNCFTCDAAYQLVWACSLRRVLCVQLETLKLFLQTSSWSISKLQMGARPNRDIRPPHSLCVSRICPWTAQHTHTGRHAPYRVFEGEKNDQLALCSRSNVSILSTATAHLCTQRSVSWSAAAFLTSQDDASIVIHH